MSEVTITITPEMRVKVMHAETFTFVLPQDIEELEVDRFQAGVFYDELCAVLGLDPVAAGYQGVIDAVRQQKLLAGMYKRSIKLICHDLQMDMQRGHMPDSYRHSVLSMRTLISNDGSHELSDAVKALSAGDEKSYSREPRQCQHGTILYGSCMLCDREAEQQGGAA